jgi:murein DD-endopeptidase MepM/ murein hydrolase activator NlpD
MHDIELQRAKRPFRPTVEWLENRCLPSMVTFENATPYTVYFVLPGEVPFSLGASQTQTYTIPDFFGQPTVGIYQLFPGRLNYALWNYGSFVFALQNGQIVSNIKPSALTFENRTQQQVSFFLSGGVSGSQHMLPAGQTQSFTVPAVVGAPRTLGVYQTDGSRRDFTVLDGAQYQFVSSNGGIDAIVPSATNPSTGTTPTTPNNPSGNPNAIKNAPELYVKLALAKARFEGNIARLIDDFTQLKAQRALRRRSALVTRDAAWRQLDAVAGPSLAAREISVDIAQLARDFTTINKLVSQTGQSARPIARTQKQALQKAAAAAKQIQVGQKSAGAAALQAAKSALTTVVNFLQQALQRLKQAVDAMQGFHAECAYSVTLKSAPVGSRQLPGESPRAHRGYDLVLKFKNNTAVPVPAADDGVVVLAKTVGQGINSFGKTVVVRYDDGTTQLFGHLNSIDVKVGQQIARGDSVGIQGRTGHATGVHVHTEIGTWKSAKGHNNFANFKRNDKVAETSKFANTYRTLLTQGAYESQCDAEAPPTSPGGGGTTPTPTTPSTPSQTHVPQINFFGPGGSADLRDTVFLTPNGVTRDTTAPGYATHDEAFRAMNAYVDQLRAAGQKDIGYFITRR